MRVIYKDDGSYIVAVETLFDSDLAEFEECGGQSRTPAPTGKEVR